MNIRELIFEIHPDLKEKYESEQYRLSNEIIKKKLQKNISQIEMANLMGLTLNDYLEMESGSLSFSPEYYQLVLDRLEI